MVLNLIGILVAAFLMFVLGGLWYSPMLFAKTWARESGTPEEHNTDPKANLRFFAILFLLLALAAAAIDCVLMDWAPGRGFTHGLSVGFIAGVLAAAVIGMDTLFERKRLTLFLINAGYYLIAFTLTGVVLVFF